MATLIYYPIRFLVQTSPQKFIVWRGRIREKVDAEQNWNRRLPYRLRIRSMSIIKQLETPHINTVFVKKNYIFKLVCKDGSFLSCALDALKS